MTDRDALTRAAGWIVLLAENGEVSSGTYAGGVKVANAISSLRNALAAPQPEPKGYIRNCHLEQRRGPSEPDWIFYEDAAGNTYCQLDGYRITPLDAPQPDVAKVMELAVSQTPSI